MNPDHIIARTPSRGLAGPHLTGPTPRASRSRRAAVRALAGGVLAAPAVLHATRAGAVKGWCRRDPVVKIGDRTVHIVLLSAAAMHDLATGPTQLIVTVPAGSATRFLADDPGFGHYGYNVSFTESPDFVASSDVLDVQVEAYAPAANPAAGPLPVVLEFTPRGGGPPVTSRAEGRANEWVRLRANVTARDLPGTGAPPPGPDPGPNGNGKKKGKQGRRDRANQAARARQGRKRQAP